MDVGMLFPDLISDWVIIVLMLTTGITSFITAAMGIGGGVLLLVVMASFVPITALIPVHGLVQMGSNANRAWLTRHHTDWQLVAGFALGAALGAAVASLIVVQLPLQVIQLSVALFILYLVWGPKPRQTQITRSGHIISGGLTTLLSMFVGVTGPLVAGLIHRQQYDKLATTANFATCMSVQHVLKLVVFSAVGFSFWQWLPLIILMVLSGMVGTWIGMKVLHRISTDRFRQLFRISITLLALRLLWQGLSQFF
ncbi:sulfite exporter TauE/SafE family protein [Neptuniibacter sp. CAU 1671]|uniref:sulfite exporter TauE/SafE family protein n=1 Tax=Neptuniibacter sp. CAU 1671 TaxID=3032593 RepID=UPI0023DC8FB2|nr:sulfite exporter TauE/SafE family protein [Neptuniibacter sp. CAU 1671]MDF2182411.1 sulfite exporter TauE/SafE family protein [Neptuniibacter sp. CAU 1671]